MPQLDCAAQAAPVLLGHRVCVRIEQAEVDEAQWWARWSDLLAPWLAPEAAPDAAMLAVDAVDTPGAHDVTTLIAHPWVGERPYTITQEYPPGSEVPGLPAYAATPSELLREVERLAFEVAIARTAHPLIVHAGAICRDDMALVLPALSDAGKTTLTYAASLGGWLPLCDDICPLREAPTADAGVIALGCPRCGHLSIASELILRGAGVELVGPVGQLSRYFRPTRWGAPAPVRAIVEPCYQEDTALSVEPLTQAEGAAALFGATFRRERVSRHDEWAAALRVARTVPAFRLRYGALDSALTGLETIVQATR